MRIAQVLLPGASEYERKCQRTDRAALSERHEVIAVELPDVATIGADVAHIYAGGELPAAAFVRFPIPYVSSANVGRSRWPWRRAAAPEYVLSPIGEQPLPEAVEDVYYESQHQPRYAETKIIGTFARPAVRNTIEQTHARLHRFRDDIEWRLFERIPTPADLADVDAWVDPAVDDRDFDGFVAEALVIGLPVVASRTPINDLRLEHGRSGWLVPPRDPNELTHAILSALFKPEVAGGKQNAARQTMSKFRVRQRQRVLAHIYETLRS